MYNAHGNIKKIWLKCQSLPPRTYGLPRSKTNSPAVSIVNAPDSVMSADCAEGSVLESLKFSTQSSGDLEIGPLVKKLDLVCRRLSDYW